MNNGETECNGRFRNLLAEELGEYKQKISPTSSTSPGLFT